MKSFVDDWRDAWVSLLAGIAVIIAFSAAWQAPLFGYNDQQSEAAGALMRNFYYPFYLCGMFLAWRGGLRLLDATWRTATLLGLFGLCVASILWSIDPSGTMRRLVALFMTILCAYALASRFSWKRLSELIAVSFGLMTVASIVLAVVFPMMGKMQTLFPGAWRGVWIEKNMLGTYMAIGFTACAAAAIHNPGRRWFWWGMSAVMVFVMLMSTSKTALVSTLIGVAGVSFVWLTGRGPVTGIVMTWLAVCALLALAGFALAAPDQLFLLLGKDPTLTGRTFIWDGIRRVVEARPTLGYGYGVVWTDTDPFAPLAKIVHVAGFRPYHAHSAWFEVWLGLGRVGLTVWSCLFAEMWLKGFYRTWRGDGGVFALPLIGIYSLSTLTESMALGWNDLHWCLAVMVFVKLSLPGDVDSTERAAAPQLPSVRKLRVVTA